MYDVGSVTKMVALTLLLTACNAPDLKKLVQTPAEYLTIPSPFKSASADHEKGSYVNQVKALEQIIESQTPKVSLSGGFAKGIIAAVESDPRIIGQTKLLLSKLADVDVFQAQKDYQISGTMYAGIEDVTDHTSGVAFVLSANRLIYDGGKTDASIESIRLDARVASLELEAKKNTRAKDLSVVWIDLARYRSLKNQIDSRLSVLEPLIQQLEKVAEAGIGDVTRVAAAQRTVSMIEATKAEVEEQLDQVSLDFKGVFGALPEMDQLDLNFLSASVPEFFSEELAKSAPALQAAYFKYQSSEAKLAAVKAKKNYTVGFESKFQRPFGGSQYDSDEQIGISVRKTLYDGKMVDSEIEKAQAEVDIELSNLRSLHREGTVVIKGAMQNILSMEKALRLAQKSAADMQDEIAYLKKQLIIGGSTLDSVLSAEARLYDARAKEINYVAQKQRSQITVLAALGLLTNTLEP
jgi:outer membrane protein TolC